MVDNMGWGYDSRVNTCVQIPTGHFYSKSVCLEEQLQNKPSDSTATKLLTGADTIVQGIGSLKLWGIIIGFAIFGIIGLILFILGIFSSPTEYVTVCNDGGMPTGTKEVVPYTINGQTKNRITYSYPDNLTVARNKAECDSYGSHLNINKTGVNLGGDHTIPATHDGTGGYLYGESGKSTLIFIGGVIGFIGIGGGIITYLLRDNVWLRRLMGIKGAMDVGKWIMGPNKMNNIPI